MASSLEQLRRFTIVVSDTGDFDHIAKFKPQDATTNPSLLYAASQLPQYQHLVDDAIRYGKAHGRSLEEQTEKALDKLAVNFGLEILKIVPGRVSTEIDARLSFDTEANVRKGRDLIALYKENGIDSDRILLKIASTWQGLQAAKILEAEGLHVHMTLLFSVEQAAVAAENGVTLISPFAGRITDFYKQRDNVQSYPPADDPGVKSVTDIYNYIRHHGYKTVVMGASFRTVAQVTELAGCDLLTISPQLLNDLKSSNIEVVKRLDADRAREMHIPKLELSESAFAWTLNENDMAHFKLGEGIRRFAADLVKLEQSIKKRLE